MRVGEAFPSSYLKTEDLRGQEVTVTINRVVMEDIKTDHGMPERKAVMYFQGSDKGWIINVTNARMIESAYGDEMDNWAGRQIILYPMQTEFQGKPVWGTRVKFPDGSGPTPPGAAQAPVQPPQAPVAPVAPAVPSAPSAAPGGGLTQELDDKIPF